MTVHTKASCAGQQKRRRARGNPQRLVDFFEANPHEELTYRDIAAKLGASEESVRVLVSRLCRAGKLEIAHVIRRKA